MIRLRSIFERGRGHPVLGPILLVVLVVLLAMVFLHVVQEGFEATELGAACVVIATVLGLLVVERSPLAAVAASSGSRTDRGPPRTDRSYRSTFAWSPAPAAPIPLRR